MYRVTDYRTPCAPQQIFFSPPKALLCIVDVYDPIPMMGVCMRYALTIVVCDGLLVVYGDHGYLIAMYKIGISDNNRDRMQQMKMPMLENLDHLGHRLPRQAEHSYGGEM